MKIRKAVIPVAGKGTRFLPATKEMSKELLPIINKPMIQYVVEEAVQSGIEQIIFVTSSGKSEIEDYFDRNMELENFLESNKKTEFQNLVKNIGTMINVCSVRQKEQLGLGHAILAAKDLVGNENFAVLLGDDLVLNEKPVTQQLIETSEENGGKAVIGVMEIPKENTNKYGIVDGDFINDSKKTLKLKSMIEKPEPSKAPSNLATPGRYVLTPEIFDCLEEIPRGVGGEFQLTDAINLHAERNSVFAHKFTGDRFDAGSIEGYLNATVEFALRDPAYRDIMENIIREKITNYGIK